MFVSLQVSSHSIARFCVCTRYPHKRQRKCYVCDTFFIQQHFFFFSFLFFLLFHSSHTISLQIYQHVTFLSFVLTFLMPVFVYSHLFFPLLSLALTHPRSPFLTLTQFCLLSLPSVSLSCSCSFFVMIAPCILNQHHSVYFKFLFFYYYFFFISYFLFFILYQIITFTSYTFSCSFTYTQDVGS